MDREKVVKDNAIHGLQSAIEISGALVHLRKEHAKAILELLKKQEEQIDTQRKNLMILLNEQKAVEPKHNPLSPTDWFCGKCGMCISRFHDYCPSCGQAVKWK